MTFEKAVASFSETAWRQLRLLIVTGRRYKEQLLMEGEEQDAVTEPDVFDEPGGHLTNVTCQGPKLVAWWGVLVSGFFAARCLAFLGEASSSPKLPDGVSVDVSSGPSCVLNDVKELMTMGTTVFVSARLYEPGRLQKLILGGASEYHDEGTIWRYLFHLCFFGSALFLQLASALVPTGWFRRMSEDQVVLILVFLLVIGQIFYTACNLVYVRKPEETAWRAFRGYMVDIGFMLLFFLMYWMVDEVRYEDETCIFEVQSYHVACFFASLAAFDDESSTLVLGAASGALVQGLASGHAWPMLKRCECSSGTFRMSAAAMSALLGGWGDG